MSDYKFRLILDPPRSATLNMAIDEILMESQQKPGAFPVLRIYFWERPACSIGYFQNVSEIKKRFRFEEKKISVVRRLTGGGMVMHGEDLTFSLSLKAPSVFVPGDAKSSYLKINEALMTGLRKIYPALDFADCKTVPSGRGRGERICFESPSCYDLLLDGKKVVGASQRRQAHALLHQSAVFLKADKDTLTQKILKGFREKWKANFTEMPLSQDEIEWARRIEAERYSSPEWAFLSDTVLDKE